MKLNVIEEIKCGQLVVIENDCQLRRSKLSDDKDNSIIGVANRDMAIRSSVEYTVNENTDDISTRVKLKFSTMPDIAIDFRTRING